LGEIQPSWEWLSIFKMMTAGMTARSVISFNECDLLFIGE